MTTKKNEAKVPPRVALPPATPRSVSDLGSVVPEPVNQLKIYWLGVKESSRLEHAFLGRVLFARYLEGHRYLESLGKVKRFLLRGEVVALPDYRIERIAEQLSRSWACIRPGHLSFVGETPRPGAERLMPRVPAWKPTPADVPLAEHLYCIPFAAFEQQGRQAVEPHSIAVTGLLFSEHLAPAGTPESFQLPPPTES